MGKQTCRQTTEIIQQFFYGEPFKGKKIWWKSKDLDVKLNILDSMVLATNHLDSSDTLSHWLWNKNHSKWTICKEIVLITTITLFILFRLSYLQSNLTVFLHLVVGIIVWSLVEYTLHRFVFHMNVKKRPVMATFHFLLHGLHHKVNNIFYLLFFPMLRARTFKTMWVREQFDAWSFHGNFWFWIFTLKTW